MKNKSSDCAICGSDDEFYIDDFLISEIESGNVVVFAGAGVSTENPNAMPHSLFDEIRSELSVDHSGGSFPDLVQRLVDLPDGYFTLIKMIENRFEYIRKFSDLRWVATRFFQELATLPYVNTYVTTNWDRHFEEYCAAKPFVYESDMRFWDFPDRRVLKIHGTIDDYSSIIASRSDYNTMQERLPTSLIGGKLKDILSNKTCIFIGYSMGDDDFLEIEEFVRDALGRFTKTHYFVSPNASSKSLPQGFVPVQGDGAGFVSALKERFATSEAVVCDDIFEFVADELDETRDRHDDLWERFDPRAHPQALASACYQDGLIHAYQIILDGRKSGKYSLTYNYLKSARGYEELISKRRKMKDYLDVAYYRGYQNVMIAAFLFGENGEFLAPPHYYFEKIGEMDRSDFEERLEELPSLHKTSFNQCERKIAELPEGDFVYQKLPWQN